MCAPTPSPSTPIRLGSTPGCLRSWVIAATASRTAALKAAALVGADCGVGTTTAPTPRLASFWASAFAPELLPVSGRTTTAGDLPLLVFTWIPGAMYGRGDAAGDVDAADLAVVPAAALVEAGCAASVADAGELVLWEL